MPNSAIIVCSTLRVCLCACAAPLAPTKPLSSIGTHMYKDKLKSKLNYTYIYL